MTLHGVLKVSICTAMIRDYRTIRARIQRHIDTLPLWFQYGWISEEAYAFQHTIMLYRVRNQLLRMERSEKH